MRNKGRSTTILHCFLLFYILWGMKQQVFSYKISFEKNVMLEVLYSKYKQLLLQGSLLLRYNYIESMISTWVFEPLWRIWFIQNAFYLLAVYIIYINMIDYFLAIINHYMQLWQVNCCCKSSNPSSTSYLGSWWWWIMLMQFVIYLKTLRSDYMLFSSSLESISHNSYFSLTTVCQSNCWIRWKGVE